jgi:hypothetical protein
MHPNDYKKARIDGFKKRKYRETVLRYRQKHPHVFKPTTSRPKITFSGLDEEYVQRKIEESKYTASQRSAYTTRSPTARGSLAFEGDLLDPTHKDERIYRHLKGERKDIFKVKTQSCGMAERYVSDMETISSVYKQ